MRGVAAVSVGITFAVIHSLDEEEPARNEGDGSNRPRANTNHKEEAKERLRNQTRAREAKKGQRAKFRCKTTKTHTIDARPHFIKLHTQEKIVLVFFISR